MYSVGVTGVAGRMGSILARMILSDHDLQLSHAVVSLGSTHVGKDVGAIIGIGGIGISAIDSIRVAAKSSDVIVDFSVPQVSVEAAEACATNGTGLVIGTTGMTDEQEKAIILASKRIAILVSPNMSLGVNLIFKLVEIAARAMPQSDAEIYEIHHRHKVDAPSGTALKLGEVVSQARGVEDRASWTHGRQGLTGIRSQGSIGFHAARGGDVVGEHTVTFAGKGERIEITHRAHHRSNFASGALQAVKYIGNKRAVGQAGLFGMNDVLGL